MGTVPTTRTFLAGERVTAANLNAATKTVQDFLLNPPRACAYASATTTTLTSGVFADITFDAEDYDSDGIHSTTTNPSRLTIQTPGSYLVTCGVNFGNNGSGTGRALSLKKNGTEVGYQFAANVALTLRFGMTTIVNNLVAGDYLTLAAYQNSGANLSLLNGRYFTFMSVQFLNP